MMSRTTPPFRPLSTVSTMARSDTTEKDHEVRRGRVSSGTPGPWLWLSSIYDHVCRMGRDQLGHPRIVACRYCRSWFKAVGVV